MDNLLDCLFTVGQTSGLVCLISSPAFVHYYESLSIQERKDMNKRIMTDSKYSDKEIKLNFIGDTFCNQPYVPIYLMHLISQFRRKKLYSNFDNFTKASFGVNEYQLEAMAKEPEFF